MARETLANNATTTLAAAITSTSATSITVTSAAAFPSSGTFRILIGTEILQVTAGQGTTTWTVTRGVEGTTAATASSGAVVSQIITAAGFLAASASANAQSAAATSTPITLTTTSANMSGMSITLPEAGTYLLIAFANASLNLSGVATNTASIYGQLYDSTNSVVLSGTANTPLMNAYMTSSTMVNSQGTGICGVLYTVTASAVINLQAKYQQFSGTTSNQVLQSGTMVAIRLF